MDEGAGDGDQPYIASVLAQEPSIDWFPVSQTGSIGRSKLKRDRVLSDDPGSPENKVCEDARRRGASLILSGWGGDEAATFNGRGALAAALSTLRPALLRSGASSPSEASRFLRRRNSARGDPHPTCFPSRCAALPAACADRPGSPAASHRFFVLQPCAAPSTSAPGLPQSLDPVGHNQLFLIRGAHLSHRMSAWAEIGADHGVAFAFPLLDRRVVECALSIPGLFFLRGGWKRRPFRDAMEGVLPETIRWRHDKLAAYPDSTHRLAAQAKQIAARMRALLSRSAVAALLDRRQVERALDQLPTPLQLVANPGSCGRAIACRRPDELRRVH